jgi:hypothetical protein
MTRWEYRRHSCRKLFESPIGDLNAFGNEGWELVCVIGSDAYFKRPILKPKTMQISVSRAYQIPSQERPVCGKCYSTAPHDDIGANCQLPVGHEGECGHD